MLTASNLLDALDPGELVGLALLCILAGCLAVGGLVFGGSALWREVSTAWIRWKADRARERRSAPGSVALAVEVAFAALVVALVATCGWVR